MKICVIGNSHVGALKRAWSELSKYHDNYDITFFAAGGNYLSNLEINDSNLTPNNEKLKRYLNFTSGGKEFISPTDYDVFLVYGVGAKGYTLDPNKFYSSAVIECAANDFVMGTLSYRLISKLRKLTNKKIYVGHNPLPAYQGDTSINQQPKAYLLGLKILNDSFYSKINAELVSQPLETIVNNRFTNFDYSKGSKKLAVGNMNDDEKHPENDRGHMNDMFGKIWLASFLKKLKLDI